MVAQICAASVKTQELWFKTTTVGEFYYDFSEVLVAEEGLEPPTSGL
jgi:hypothetical protein